MAKQNWKYNFDFDQFDLEPLPDHTCAICMNVFRDPRQNICGHVFCVRCLERWLITEKRDSCPLCRASMTPSQLTPVKDDLQDAIGRLTLHCASEGCPDMLSINTYGDHMDECELYPVPCHWYFCRSSVPRKDLHQHMQGCQFKTQACGRCGIPQIVGQQHSCKVALQTCIQKFEQGDRQCGKRLGRIELSKSRRRETQLIVVSRNHVETKLADLTTSPSNYTIDNPDPPSSNGPTFEELLLNFQSQFSDPNKARFEVPQIIDSPATQPSSTQYEVKFPATDTFSFHVIRKSTGAIVFDTLVGGLQFSDQFLQIATRLDSDKVYGFGEREHRTLLHDLSTYNTESMYARDIGVGDFNLYGVQPFYINVEKTNNAHGVLFLNSNAQEVAFMPAPGLTYRTIGGILDIYFFFGPTPESVVQQYTAAIGRPLMVPYWSLGFQLSRWGYTSLDSVKTVVGRMRQYDIPHDVQYGDIDYMDNKKIFTYDQVGYAGLPEYVQQLKSEGTRFVIILDPGVYNQAAPGTYSALDEGNRLDAWVKGRDGTTSEEGEVWPGKVFYPDFQKPITQTWYNEQAVNFHQLVEYAGLWIDMNEPSNFVDGSATGCPNNSLNEPPYMPAIEDRSLWKKTVCPDVTSAGGKYYDVHSLYGWSMSKMTLEAARVATGTRSIAFSRSTFPGSGKYAQHWLGDNNSRWTSLKYSLIGAMEFNMFGYPYIGPDICGFNDDTTEQLCQRWQQIGAFYTFSRNHNSIDAIDQDPGAWPEVARVTRETLLIRYTLLPYLYTLMHKAHAEGSTVIRPLFFEFPGEAATYSIDEQIMWASALLISPVLYQNAVTVQAYIPNAKWFSYYDGGEVSARGAFVQLAAPLDFIPLHIRGGYILPTQKPANSTMWSRLNPMGLIVALNDVGQANGDLFWDDGESIDTFENGAYYFATYSALSSGQLSSTVTQNGYATTLYMDNVKIMGINQTVTSVTVNWEAHTEWAQDSSTFQLTITGLNLPLATDFIIQWSVSKVSK